MHVLILFLLLHSHHARFTYPPMDPDPQEWRKACDVEELTWPAYANVRLCDGRAG